MFLTTKQRTKVIPLLLGSPLSFVFLYEPFARQCIRNRINVGELGGCRCCVPTAEFQKDSGLGRHRVQDLV